MTQDTPQDTRVLRQSKAARIVRKAYPTGTRVEGAPGVYGTVTRHVPIHNALGGYLVVQWDSGMIGRHTVASPIHKKESES